MNIILNSYCNLTCNYCFADEYMEETVKTPGKSMEYDYFLKDFLPKIKNTPIINFMGGEPTLHPRFNDIFRNTYKDVLPYSHLSVFSNGLMPDKVLDLMLEMAGPKGARNKNVVFAILLNWQTLENISEKNHERCKEVAEKCFEQMVTVSLSASIFIQKTKISKSSVKKSIPSTRRSDFQKISYIKFV